MVLGSEVQKHRLTAGFHLKWDFETTSTDYAVSAMSHMTDTWQAEPLNPEPLNL
jgi:hypothetical protein